MKLVEKLARAAHKALAQINADNETKGEDVWYYCRDQAELVKRYLEAAGFKNRVFTPDAGHIWASVGDYIIDLWEPNPPYRVKIVHFQSPEIQSDPDYQWPGKEYGLRPIDCESGCFTTEEIVEFYEDVLSDHRDMARYLAKLRSYVPHCPPA